MTIEDTIETPVVLTTRAAQQVRTFADDNTKPLRVSIRGGGCSGFEYILDFDEPRETDFAYESEGVKVVIDPVSSRYLKGTIIDYETGLVGAGFVFNNPNARASCGCGQSFSTDDYR